jgi:hypothetical protein
MTHVQRFGGSLNLNCHYHVLVLDGVYVQGLDGVMAFRSAAPPSQVAIERVARRVHDRAIRWLTRHGHLDARRAEERGNDVAEPSALDGCAQLALRQGAFAAIDEDGVEESEEDDAGSLGEKRQKRFTAVVDGFNVHAAVRVAADNDEARERLVRYCARPTLALERLSVLPDGRVAYRVKYPRGDKTHRMMTPVEFLARAAALLPPPRYPLVRYHGVLAPHSKLRALVVPRPPASVPACPKHVHEAGQERPASPSISRPAQAQAQVPVTSRAGQTTPASQTPSFPSSAPLAPRPSGPALATPLPKAGVAVGPNAITVEHWERLLGGALFATAPRVAWATLLQRTFAIDALACPGCGGRLRLLSAITEPATARKILEHLGLPTHPAPAPRARGPD